MSTDSDHAPDPESESESTSDSGAGSGTDLETEPTADPARSTYAWGDYDCVSCGDGSERVWRDGEGRLVCPDCKEW
nr:hypothetical protein [Halobiforma nitratireducens]